MLFSGAPDLIGGIGVEDIDQPVYIPKVVKGKSEILPRTGNLW